MTTLLLAIACLVACSRDAPAPGAPGTELPRVGEYPIYRVARFVEKPDVAAAAEYVASGEYYWNAGIFAWSAESIRARFEQHLPDMAGALAPLAERFGTPEFQPEYDRVYPAIRNLSIDVGIMEPAPDVAVIPASFSWVDVGSWKELYEALAAMYLYLEERAEEKRREPADDLLSYLVHAEDDGERMTHDELMSQLVTLYMAGHEPTAGLVGNGVLALLGQPDQLARLRTEPGLLRNAVSELLRGTRVLADVPSIGVVDLEANNRTWDTIAERGAELGVYTDARPPYGCLGLRLTRE